MKCYRCFVALLAIFFLMSGLAYGGAEDMAKQANKLVRDAERNMFNGKMSWRTECLGRLRL